MSCTTRRTVLRAAGGALAWLAGPQTSQAGARSEQGVRHSFLALGGATYLVSEQDETLWEWPDDTRDGWVLPSTNILLVTTRVQGQHGGRVLEVTRKGDIVFQYDGTQDEVNTVQPLADGRILTTEAGKNPRILELDRSGKIVFELPLDCQKENSHTQSRMTRKLANGNYLVPLMVEREVREYTPKGEVVWRAQTPHWPFTAIRLANGNTVVNGTQANQTFEFDAAGTMVWSVSNEEVHGALFDGLCGAQRLPNGNTVIASYRNRGEAPKLTEVDRDKKAVWSYRDARPVGIHHIHILTTNGAALPGTALR